MNKETRARIKEHGAKARATCCDCGEQVTSYTITNRKEQEVAQCWDCFRSASRSLHGRMARAEAKWQAEGPFWR